MPEKIPAGTDSSRNILHLFLCFYKQSLGEHLPEPQGLPGEVQSAALTAPLKKGGPDAPEDQHGQLLGRQVPAAHPGALPLLQEGHQNPEQGPLLIELPHLPARTGDLFDIQHPNEVQADDLLGKPAGGLDHLPQAALHTPPRVQSGGHLVVVVVVLPQHLGDDVCLGTEVDVKGALGGPRLSDDLVHRDPVIALLPKQLHGAAVELLLGPFPLCLTFHGRGPFSLLVDSGTSPAVPHYTLSGLSLQRTLALAGALASGVVNGVLPGEDKLGDGHKGVPLLGQLFQNGGQGLRGVEGGVVEEDDGPRPHLAGHPLGDLFRRDLLPVQAVHIPLDGLHADRPGGLHRLVVVVPVGHAHQGGPHARDRLDLVVAGVEVGHHLLGGELGVVGVGVGVVHHLVARVGKGFHGLGVFIHPGAHHKEGGLHPRVAQGVGELLGILVAPG